MKIKCNSIKCKKCNLNCILNLPYSNKLKNIYLMKSEKIFELQNVKESLKIINKKEIYHSLTRYELEIKFNKLKNELIELQIEEKNIIQTLHRINK